MPAHVFVLQCLCVCMAGAVLFAAVGLVGWFAGSAVAAWL
jgi:hypothetical protein